MEYSSPFYILIMLSFPVTVDSTCTDGECRELSFPARFFFRGKRLENHLITTVQVRDLGVCELLCYHNHNCVSINFEVTKSHDNKHRCDLNNATHQKHDNEFQNADYFLYRGADSACDTAHCYSNATCQSGFTSKGYKCLCPPGFNGEHCKQDIDECSQPTHNCSPDANCNNTFGSYKCKCKQGFTGDGYNCTDIDECASAVHNCSANAVCNNSQGSYSCKCKPGFICCPEGWTQYNVSCYYMTTSRSRNVSDAREKCKDMGADLPVIYSKEENDFIIRNVNDNVPEVDSRWIWLGLLRNNSTDSCFFWVDGTPIKGNYAAWRTNEPNNVNDNENCAYMGNDEKWNDFPCENYHEKGPYVLCQMAM